MKFPEIDLKELKEWKKQNFKNRLEFLDRYAEWVKNKNNTEWSEQQRKMIDRGHRVNLKHLFGALKYFKSNTDKSTDELLKEIDEELDPKDR